MARARYFSTYVPSKTGATAMSPLWFQVADGSGEA